MSPRATLVSLLSPVVAAFAPLGVLTLVETRLSARLCHNAPTRWTHPLSEVDGLLTPRGLILALGRDRASLGALGGSLVAQATLVVSGPATARLLGVTGRGRLALFVIIVSVTSQVAAIGLPTAVAYATSSSGISAAQLLRVLARPWIGLCLVAATVAGAAAFVVSRADHSSSGWLESALAITYVVAAMNFTLVFACLQGERRFVPMNWLRIAVPCITAILLLALWGLAHHVSVRVVLVFTHSPMSWLAR